MTDQCEHGRCQKCSGPLESVERYDIAAAQHGEARRVTVVCCLHCESVLLNEFLAVLSRDNPNIRQLYDLIARGVPVDDLPGRLSPAEETAIQRLLKGVS